MTAHWEVEGLAAVERTGENKLDACCKVSHSLENHIKLFVSLPLSKLDNMKIKEEIDAIGKA